MHSAHRAALHLLHDRLDGARKTFVIALHIGQHLHAALRLGQRRRRLFQRFPQGLHLSAAAFRFQRHALHLIFRPRKGIQAATHALFQLVMRVLFRFQTPARSFNVGHDRPAPSVHAG